MYSKRIDKVIENMKKRGLSQLLVTDPDSILYLTGIYNNPMERFWGFLIKESGENVLFANRLFRLRPLDCKTLVFDDTDDICSVVCPLLSGGKLGVDSSMKARFLLPFMDRLAGLRPVLSDECVGDVRACKDEDELEKMRKSSQINDMTMKKVAEFFHDGCTELECADFIKQCYSDAGANGLSFSPIVSFGANAADPHHGPDKTVLKDGDCIVVDIGCKWMDYCSDMTRTFYWKSVTEEEKKIYDITLQANILAEQTVRPGVKFMDIDLAGRNYIEENGYGEFFTHRLGHSIGLADHEGEDVSKINDHTVKPGMCFSSEPGIYLTGKTGVRIEDLVAVTEDGCEILNHYTKELTILGV